jgi:hypothetical protein
MAGEGKGGAARTSTTCCPTWGATPHRCGASANSIAPTVEAGIRSVKRGENRAPSRAHRGVPGSRAARRRWSERAPRATRVGRGRTHDRAVVMTYRRRWDRRATGVARHRRPKMGEALGASGLSADWPCTHIQPGGQCGATAAEHGRQERGNRPRALRLSDSVAVGAGRCAEPQARGTVGWPKKRTLGVTPETG